MFQGMQPLDPGFGEDSESSWGEYAYQTPDGKTVSEKFVISRLSSSPLVLTSSHSAWRRVQTIPGSYLDYYKNVAGAINGTGTLEVTPEHAEVGMRIIEAAKVSHREKRTVEF